MNRTETLQSEPSIGPRSFPRRLHYAVLFVAYLLLATYGSFVPLNYKPLDWNVALDRLAHIRYLQLGLRSRADWVANILLFVPLSYLALGLLTVDLRSRILRLAASLPVLLGCAALSVAIEFCQLWFPDRTVSLNDIAAESLGGLVGVALWLTAGQAVTDWIRSYSAATRRRTQIDRLLEFYLAGLVLYSLMPLDLTISPAELMTKFRSGRIVLVPFSDCSWGLYLPFRLFTDVAVFVPVGMLLATAWRTPRQPLRSLTACGLLGSLFVAVLEVMQIPVFTRTSSTTQLLTGTLGVLIGAMLMRHWRRAETAPTASSSPPLQRPALLLAAAVAYSLILIAVFCVGDSVIRDPAVLRQRFDGFWRIPFASLYRGSEFNALSDILRKTLFFMPLGALLTWAIATLRLPARISVLLLCCVPLLAAGVSFAVEMVQVMVPPHVPDVTDVLLGTAGATCGLLITWKIVHAREEPPSGV